MVSLSDFDVPSSAPVPPQNLEAEESVLGAAMMSPAALDACRNILRGDGGEFYRESHARIWRAALALADAGEPVDAVTLADQLAERGQLEDIGGKPRLYELAALVPATANASHYAQIVVENAQLRDLIYIGSNIARLGWDRPGSIDELRERALGLVDRLLEPAGGSAIEVESWAQFERSATETIPMLVDQLWPENGLGFIAAPPKKGKTWIGLSLAVSIATGKRFLNAFEIPQPQPVVLLALEGHRAAIRGRIGCLAHGLGIDPHTDPDLRQNLHISYKPVGLNLADPAWIRTIRDLVKRVGARALVVDVLRAAAVLKENSNDEFRDLVRALAPIQQQGCAIAMLHHFGKLTELSRERTPGERMAGAGAMYGAFDVGVFITKSDDGARTLRLEFETRDVVAAAPLGIELTGETTGSAGGFTFNDAATWAVLDETPEADEVKAPSAEIAAYVLDQGGEVDRRDVEAHFQISPDTLSKRVLRLWSQHRIELVRGRGRGARSRLVHRPEDPADAQLVLPDQSTRFSYDPESHESKLNGGSDFTPTKTLDSALVTETKESHDLDDSSQTESADLQGELSHESFDSPTERQAPADAEQSLRNDFDPPEDT